MRSALVDNSTLSAVQRLIGDIPVARSFAIEGDVAAFDQYLQTLLIYDEVAVIDDYKEEYRLDRQKRFDEIRFINPTKADYERATQVALSTVADIEFRIERGKVAAGPMAKFLDALNLHVLPAWYMASSNWYLHLRILADESAVDVPKYGALMNAIDAEFRQSSRSEMSVRNNLYLQGRSGEEIDVSVNGDGSVDGDVQRFALGLNWIAQRTAFYTFLAETYKSAFSLHPIRHAFAGQYLATHLMPQSSPDFRKRTLEFFKHETGKIRNASDQIIGSAGDPIELPFFAAWAVGHAGNPRDGHDHVRQIRSSREAQALRSRFREIESLEQESNASFRIQSAKLRSAISQDLQQLSKRFTGQSGSPPIDIKVDLVKMTPSISISGVAEKVLRVIPTPNRISGTLLRNISRDFMQIPMMGVISDRFSHSRKIRKGTEFIPDRTRIEDRKWSNVTSSWKRPL